MKTHKPMPRHKLVNLMMLAALTACLCGASRSTAQNGVELPDWIGAFTYTLTSSSVSWGTVTIAGGYRYYQSSESHGEYRVTLTINADGTTTVEAKWHQYGNGSTTPIDFAPDIASWDFEETAEFTGVLENRRVSVSPRADGGYEIFLPEYVGRNEGQRKSTTVYSNGRVEPKQETFWMDYWLGGKVTGQTDPCATVLSDSRRFTQTEQKEPDENAGIALVSTWTQTHTWNLRRNVKPLFAPYYLSPSDHTTVSPTPTFKVSLPAVRYFSVPLECDPMKSVIEVTRLGDNTPKRFESDFYPAGQTATLTVPSEQPLENGLYRWRAKAVDSQGVQSEWSDWRTFRVGQSPCLWGAGVQVTLNDGQTFTDFLVAYSGGSIILQSDLTIDEETEAVAVNRSIPLSNVRSLIVDGGGVNKYFADLPEQKIRTYGLLGYSNGVWTIQQHYTTLEGGRLVEKFGSPITPNQVNALCALPQCPERSAESVGQLLAEAGQRLSIPPHILFGVAYHESGRTYQQFRDGWTLITHDGGIGLMQLTQGTALVDANFLHLDALTHLHLLSSDTAYNIEAGARILRQKKSITPPIGSGADEVLEHWYYALWAYNGWLPVNFPNGANTPYQEWILKHITNSYRWTPVSISRPLLADLGTTFPPKPIPYTPVPAHVDRNFDGVIDEVRTPNLSVTVRLTQGKGKKITATFTLTNNGTADAPNAQVNNVTLGNALKTVNQNLGLLRVGASQTVRVSFARPKNKKSKTLGWTLQGTYLDKPFSASGQATLP